MRSRCAAVITRDARLYADLVGLLRELGLDGISLLPGERIPERVGVVLTSPEEGARIAHPCVLRVSPDSDRRELAPAIRAALHLGGPVDALVVGIDPGPRPGYSVLAGDAGLEEGTLDDPESAAGLASRLRQRFPAGTLRFRVGSGDRVTRDRIVRALWDGRTSIELVDERNTTPRGRRRPRDLVAARRIAETRGHLLRSLPPVRITPGDIAVVQRLSRESSGGTLTISRAVATRVLSGEISLEEAVDARRPVPSAGRSPRPPRPVLRVSQRS